MRKVRAHDRESQQAAEVDTPSGTALAAESELSSARARIPDIIPAGWLDRLLVASLDLPIFSGSRAVLEAALDAVAVILPHYAVGACFIPEPSSVFDRAVAGATDAPSAFDRAVARAANAPAAMREQIVVHRVPQGAAPESARVDPTRIFPGFEHEYVTSILGSSTGSTLHLASNEDDLDRSSSAAVHLVERAAMALGRALSHAQVVGSADGERQEARALQQRMLQADKLANFGQIAAGVVHELNNPLTSIVAYSDYLMRKAASGAAADEDDVERLRRIHESASRMLRFTRDLVSYAHPSSGAARPVVLHGLIDQAIAFCEHVLSAAGVRVERRYEADAIRIQAVGEQLVQVFVNLLTNASQAAPTRDGCVVVTTGLAKAPDGARLALVVVEDNGSGIAPEHLPQVFVPFFTTKRDRQGTGLGLSIVKNVLESHGGAIRVESELGLGTRFVIELPVE
jgi:two-component system NtrC family sensor kinase